MPNEIAGGAGSAHRGAPDHSQTAAPKQGTAKHNASGTPRTASQPEAGTPSCGIANMSDTPPVSYLPHVTVPQNSLPAAFSVGANADASSQGAGATCQAAPARPATQAQPNNSAYMDPAPPAWKQRLDVQLSQCLNVDDYVDVLKGETNSERQQYVVDRALFNFMDLDAIDGLAKAVKDNPSLRMIVVDRLLQQATHYESIRSRYVFGGRLGTALLNGRDQNDPDTTHRRKEFASHCAAGVVKALGPFSDRELGEYLGSLPKDQGKNFALALGGEHTWRDIVSNPELAKLHRPTAALIDRVLVALNHAPNTPASGTIAQNLFLQILPTDFSPRRPFEAPALSPHNVAVAIANVWYPENHAQAKLATVRVEDLLKSRRGVDLMFGGTPLWRMQLIFDVVHREAGITAQTFANYDGDPMRHPAVTHALARKLVSLVSKNANVQTPAQAAAAEVTIQRMSGVLQTDAGQNLISGPAPEKAKLEAWAAIAGDSRITRETFPNDNPFANPLLQERIAPLYIAAGEPQEFSPIALRNMVSFSLGLAPTFPKDTQFTAQDIADLQQALAQGAALKDLPPHLAYLFTQTSLFAKNETVEKISTTLENRAGTHPPKVAFEFDVVFTEVGPVRCPAYRVQVAGMNATWGGPQYEYVDNIGRYYRASDGETSLDNYLHHNQLPKGALYYTPHNPFGTRDRNGIEVPGHRDTPATDNRVGDAIDSAATAGCFAAGVVGVVFSGGALGLAAGFVGGVGAGWGTYRGYQTIADRAAHGQSVDPFAPGAEGREAALIWAGTVASGVNAGVLAAATGFIGARAVGLIGNEATWATTSLRALGIGAAGTNIAALTVSAADLVANHEHMTKAQIDAAVAQLIFGSVLAAHPLVASHPAATPVASTERAPLPPALAEMAVNKNKPAENANLVALKGGKTEKPSGYDPTRGRASNDEAAPRTEAQQQQVQQQSVAMAANGGGTVSTALDPAQTRGARRNDPPGPKGPTGHPRPRPSSDRPASNPYRNHPRPGSPSGTRRAPSPDLRAVPERGARPPTPPPSPDDFAGPEELPIHNRPAWISAHAGSEPPPATPPTARPTPPGTRRAASPDLRVAREHGRPPTPQPDPAEGFEGPEGAPIQNDMSAWIAAHAGPVTGTTDPATSPPQSSPPPGSPPPPPSPSQPVREFDPTRRQIWTNLTPESRARIGLPPAPKPSWWTRVFQIPEWMRAAPATESPRRPSPPPTPQPSDPRHWARIWDRSDLPEIGRPPADPETAQTVIQTNPQTNPAITAIGPRGGVSIDARTFVEVFRDVALHGVPDQAEFIGKVVTSLGQLKSDVRKTITVGDFFEIVHNWGLLEHEDVAAGLDSAMHDLVSVPEQTNSGVISGEINPEADTVTQKDRKDSILQIDQLIAALKTTR